MDLHRKTKGHPADLGHFSFPAAYSGPRILKEAKIHDILSMLDFIPPVHHDFHSQLVSVVILRTKRSRIVTHVGVFYNCSLQTNFTVTCDATAFL